MFCLAGQSGAWGALALLLLQGSACPSIPRASCHPYTPQAAGCPARPTQQALELSAEQAKRSVVRVPGVLAPQPDQLGIVAELLGRELDASGRELASLIHTAPALLTHGPRAWTVWLGWWRQQAGEGGTAWPDLQASLRNNPAVLLLGEEGARCGGGRLCCSVLGVVPGVQPLQLPGAPACSWFAAAACHGLEALSSAGFIPSTLQRTWASMPPAAPALRRSRRLRALQQRLGATDKAMLCHLPAAVELLGLELGGAGAALDGAVPRMAASEWLGGCCPGVHTCGVPLAARGVSGLACELAHASRVSSCLINLAACPPQGWPPPKNAVRAEQSRRLRHGL